MMVVREHAFVLARAHAAQHVEGLRLGLGGVKLWYN